MKPLTNIRDESPCPYQRANTVLCHPFLLGGDSPVWRFYCEDCGEYHTHGCGEGWRVAHHNDRGRKRRASGSYYLVLDPAFEKESA